MNDAIRHNLLRAAVIVGVAARLLVVSGQSMAEDRFLSVIDDLPLMAQLGEVPGSAVVYSKPQGRIVEVTARGAVSQEAVLTFYGNTLPQLGWTHRSDGTWQRDEERLALSFERGEGGLTVQFSLAPR